MRTGLEKVLVNLDIGVSGALLRIGVGILLVPALEAAFPETHPWMLGAWLLVVLFAIKVFAAVARRPFSGSTLVRSHWEWRRHLARYYDSYQWRKLLWIGAGVMLGGALGWPGTRAQWILGAVCSAAGAVGEIAWRRHRLGLAPLAP